jgi:predicted acylesterase/phospholipase RssA
MGNSKIRLALSVSGAVSLGSYQAGVIYELFDLMQKLQDRANFTIDVITGASAGSVNSAILALAMMYDPKLIDFTKRIWLEGLDISALLEKVDDPWESLLCNKVILKLKSDIVDAVKASSAVAAKHFPDRVKLGLTLTNLSGIPYHVQFTNIKKSFQLTTFADWYTVELNKGDRSAKTLTEIDHMLDIAIASAAFPFAFPAQRLKRRCADYQYTALKPTPSGKVEFIYVDGGVFNNEPINRARELADQLDREDTERTYLLVDPTPPQTADAFSDSKMLSTGKRLIPAIFTEAHFRDWSQALKVNQRIEWQERFIKALRTKTSPLGFSSVDTGFSQAVNKIADEIADFKARKAKKDKDSYLETNLGRIYKTLSSHQALALQEDQGGSHEYLAKLIFILENIAGLREKKILDLRLIIPPEDGMLAGDFLISFGGFFSIKFREHDFNIGRSAGREFISNPKSEGGLGVDLSGFRLEATPYDASLNEISIKDAPLEHRVGLRDNVLKKVDGLINHFFLKPRTGLCICKAILTRIIGGLCLILAAVLPWRWCSRLIAHFILKRRLNNILEIKADLKIPRDPELALDRLKVVLWTMGLNIIAVMVFANVTWSDWRTGMGLNLLDNALLVTYTIIRRDRLMAHFLAFGVVLGFSELLADAWLVDFTRTLDYSIGGGPMIWRSPLWMPFAWEVVAVQFAVLGGWLMNKFKRGGLLLTGLIGAVNIPFYEELALKTQWWAYESCRMFLHTPYYIILGEFGIVIGITLLASGLQSGHWGRTVLAGIMGGLAIFVCYAIAFWIFEWRI